MNNTILHETYRPNNRAETGRFTMLAFFLAGIATTGIIAGIIYHPLFFTACGASVAGSFMLIWRIVEHDKRAFTIRTVTEPEPEQAAVPQIQPIIMNDNHVRLGRFKLQPDEWRRLASVLQVNDWRFTRDIVQQAGLFPNITKHWREIYADFERLEIVGNYQVTQTGRDWFAQSLPSPNGNHA